MKKILFITIVLTIAVALSEAPSSLAGTPKSSATIHTLNNKVTGFGATRVSWDAHHVTDPNKNTVPGSGYDRFYDAKIGESLDRYEGVEWSNGIAIGYLIAALTGTKLKDAMAQAMNEMPSDSKIAFFYSNHLSGTLEVYSPTLKRILTDPKIGFKSGAVDFMFCTVSSDGSTSYNTANINEIWVAF